MSAGDHGRRLRRLLRPDQRCLPDDLRPCHALAQRLPADPRMSRSIKLVLMGVGGAGVTLFLCAGVGAGLGARPTSGSSAIRSTVAPAALSAGPAATATARQRRAAGGDQAAAAAAAAASAHDDRDRRRAASHATAGPQPGAAVSARAGQLEAARPGRAEHAPREQCTPRPGWQNKLEQLGFDYYVLDGKAYWTEQACYAFSSDRDRPARGRHRGAARPVPQGGRVRRRRASCGSACASRQRGATTSNASGVAPIRRSVGRFDLAYDGKGPPKLLEYNADTPTALYEAAVVQWYWLKDVKPEADQFNSIHEKLIERLARRAGAACRRRPGPFRPLRGPARGSRDLEYLRDTAPAGRARRQADRRHRSAGTAGASRIPTRCRSRC